MLGKHINMWQNYRYKNYKNKEKFYMYKLVAIDCDGTLLNSTGYIPEENIKIIKELTDKGIKFIIATGRNDILAADYVDELSIKAPIIGCNGASLRYINSNKPLYFKPIQKNALKEIFSFCKENKLYFKAFSLDKAFTDDKEAIRLGIKSILSKYTKVLTKNMTYIYTNDTSRIVSNEKIIKVCIVDNNPASLLKIQSKLKGLDGISVCRSAVNCIDICEKSVSKGNALKAYAEIIGIDKSEVIAFGDSENDLSMLSFAGFSVAMQNAEEVVKDSASMVTDTNDNAGVGKALKKIFL